MELKSKRGFMDSIDDPQTFQHMGVATKSRFYVVIHPLVKSDSHQLQGSCSLLFTAAVQPAMLVPRGRDVSDYTLPGPRLTRSLVPS